MGHVLLGSIFRAMRRILEAYTVAHIQCVPLVKLLVVLDTTLHLCVMGEGLLIFPAPSVPSLVVMANTKKDLVMEQQCLI